MKMNLTSTQFCILICLAFFLLSNSSYGQLEKITGTVISKIGSEPVPYVGIGIIGKPTGAVTNAEGRFALYGSPHDTVCVSHINYETKKIVLSSLKPEGYTITLSPKVYILDEVAIEAESIVGILKKSISHSREGLGIPLRLETYYREFVKIDNHYTKFSDGLLHYDLLGSAEKPKTRVSVVQSRAKELPTETDQEMDWDLTSPIDVGKALNPFLLEKLDQIAENAVQYDFQILSRSTKTDENRLEIRFAPKLTVQEPLYNGIVIVDKSTKYIVSFNCELEQNPEKPGKEKNLIFLKGSVTQFSLTVLFKLSGSNYEPWYSGIRAGLRLWNNKKFDHTFLFMSDLVVNKTVVPPFDLITNKEAYNKKALYSLGSNYQFDFWKDQNTIQLTEEEEGIINQFK